MCLLEKNQGGEDVRRNWQMLASLQDRAESDSDTKRTFGRIPRSIQGLYIKEIFRLEKRIVEASRGVLDRTIG